MAEGRRFDAPLLVAFLLGVLATATFQSCWDYDGNADRRAAADSAAARHARSTAAAARRRNQLVAALTAEKERQGARVGRTERATAGVHLSMAALDSALAAGDTAAARRLQPVVDALRATVVTLEGAVVAERQGGAQALARADAVIVADSVEIARQVRRVVELERQVGEGLTRERQLLRRVHGWRLGFTFGPGLSYSDEQLRVAPLQVAVGLTHAIALPNPLRWFQ